MQEQTPKSADFSLEDSIVSTDPQGIFDWIFVFLFIAIVTIMLLSVFYRYVLNASLAWTDETIRFAFVWFTFLGAALVFRDNVHIRVDYLLEMMPPGLRLLLEKTARVLAVAFYLFLFVAGLVWVFETRGTRMSSVDLPLNWCFYFALPATSVVALYYAFFPKRPDESAQ